MDRKWGLVVGTVVLLVLVLAGMGYGVYRLVMKLTPSVLAVWAMRQTETGRPVALPQVEFFTRK